MLTITNLETAVPAVSRLYLVQGNTGPLYFTVNTQCPDGTTLDQKNLTGCTVWFTLKRYLADADASAIVQKNSGTSNIIIDPTMGLIKITFATVDTAGLPQWYQDYYYDIQIKDAAGNYITGGCGSLGIYPSFTVSK